MPTMTQAGYTPPPKPVKPEKPKKKKKKSSRSRRAKRRMSVAAVVSLVIFLLAAALGAGTLYVYTQVKAYSAVFARGLTLDGYSLSGLSSAEGENLLAKLTDEAVQGWSCEITCQGRSYSLSAEDISLHVDAGLTLDPLWQIGKTGGLAERFVQLLQARQDGVNTEPVLAYQMEPVDALLEQIRLETDCEAVDATISFVPGSSEPFRFTDEVTGYALDVAPLREAVEHAILMLTPLELEAQPQVLAPTVLRATLEGAITLRARVTLTLTSDEDALQNAELAAGMLQGVRLEAGESLSFNDRVGRRTVEGGYVIAPEEAYGTDVSGVGGGICQVSTALYQLALLGDLAVEERSAAVRPVTYAEMGQEAAVSDQGLDLVLRNTTDTPMFFTSRVYVNDEGASILELQVIGAPLSVRYALRTQVLDTQTIEEPVYVRDSEGRYATYTDERVPVGEGEPGYTVQVERVTLDEAGEEAACEEITTDTYEAIAPAVYVGVQTREAQ